MNQADVQAMPACLSGTLRNVFAVAVCAMLAACATTQVDISGAGLRQPLCTEGGARQTLQVYWLPHWRPDQKEPPLREAAALRGIEDFFAGLSCVERVTIRRLPGAPAADVPSDRELLVLAAGAEPEADRVLLIAVRELGPRLVIGIPALVEGGTEVVVEVRVLDARTAESLADVRTQWRHGGKFYIKGVGTLDHDMSTALRATLMPDAAAR